MRVLLLLFLYITVAENALAQRAVVGLPKMNILYVGLENPIDVAVDGIKPKDIAVKINGGELKGENGKYVFIPDGSDRLAVLKIGKKKRNKIIWVDSFEYRIRKLPKPEVLFGTKSGGNISRGELMTVSRINVGMGEGFVFEGIRFKVTSFTIVVITPDFLYEENVTGYKITANTKRRLQQIKNGALIFIQDVFAESKGIVSNPKDMVLKVPGTDFINENFILSGKEIDSFGSINITKSNLSILNPDVQFSSKNIKDSLWQLISTSSGKPFAEYFYDRNILKWSKTYFSNGSIKSIKNYNYQDSTASYIDYYENGSVFKKGQILTNLNYFLVVDLDCYNDNIFRKYKTCDLSEINECLYSKWEVFYSNGKLKETGKMDTTYTNTFYFEDKIYFDPVDHEPIENTPIIFSVRHGLWKFYDEKGNLIRQKIYDKGRIKE